MGLETINQPLFAVRTGSDATLTAKAPAKVNLTLAVLGRRSDGYHRLDSLVAFASASDLLTLRPGPALDLSVSGPGAAHMGNAADNLVLRAARNLADRRPGIRLGAFELVKRLPVASGLGGGSSDAAAALRCLARLNGLPRNDPDLRAAAQATGSDVPVCLDAVARWMRGVGEDLSEPIALARVPAVLVNVGRPVATASVFKGLALAPGQDRPRPTAIAHEVATLTEPDALIDALAAGTNDLAEPAIALVPEIAAAIHRLAGQPGCRLARMSGSGATVFGLFQSCRTAAAAARRLRADQPGWWVVTTAIG